MSFTGSCHCGRLSYTVNEPLPTKGLVCNCSICKRKGNIHHFTSPDKFTFLGSASDIAEYQFNKHLITHQFCKQCGCAPFAHGTDGKGNNAVEINLRCVSECDIEALEITQYNGASL